jgi:hypothetical protein
MKITNDAEYNAACDRIVVLMELLTDEDDGHYPTTQKEKDEFENLTLEVEDYEQQEADKVEALYEL